MAAKITKLTEKQKLAATVITDHDLEDMENLLTEVEERVQKAHGDGRTFMMAQYVRIVALISPEIDRIQRRFKRESLAAHRRAYKELKLDQDQEPGDHEGEGA